jgi:hypothetical protein
LPSELYITASSIISNKAVYKNGVRQFAKNDAGISDFLLAAYHHFNINYPKFYKMDNLSKLGWLASEVLLANSFEVSTYKPEKVGLILANKNSSLDDDIKYYRSAADVASPSLFVYTLPNIVIGEISIRNKFKGEHAFYLQENFDTIFIEQQVSYLLNNNRLDACICGWVDVLEEDYKAVLYLVEKGGNKDAQKLSSEEMKRIFNLSDKI